MIFIIQNVDEKLDEYASFLKSIYYTTDEAKIKRWEVEYQINKRCNPILMKEDTCGELKFKSVLKRYEIETNVNNLPQLMQIINRRKGTKGNTQWIVDYLVSVYITDIKYYNTFSESIDDILQDVRIINRIVREVINEILHYRLFDKKGVS